MENLFIKQLEMDANFDYKILYSQTKSSATNENLKAFLKEGLLHKEIEIKKYLVADNISEELDELEEWKEMSHKKIKAILKDWHSESDYSLIPILYILEKLEPKFTVEPDAETKVYSIQSNKKIDIGYRFHSQDAFARIFLSEQNMIINLTSDSLQNLINSLMIEGIKVYLLDLEWVTGTINKMVAYELSSSQRFKNVKIDLDDRVIAELF